MLRRFIFILALAGCSSGSDKAPPPAGGTASDAGAASDPGSPATTGASATANSGGSMTPGGPPARPNTLAEGTSFVVRTQDPILSSAANAGYRFTARVVGQVLDSQGAIMINALAQTGMRVVRMEKSPDGKSGRVEFGVDSLLVRGRYVPIEATVGEVPNIVTGAGIVLVDRATEIRITLTKTISAPPLP